MKLVESDKIMTFLYFAFHVCNQDNSLRPNFGGLPAVVEIDLMVRSMGPVSEVEMVMDRGTNCLMNELERISLKLKRKLQEISKEICRLKSLNISN